MNQTPSDIESNLGDFFVFKTTGDFVSSVVSAVIVIGALASLIFVVYGAFSWIISGDDKAKLEQAQKTITNALIGLVITVAAFAIWSLVKSFLGLDETLVTP